MVETTLLDVQAVRGGSLSDGVYERLAKAILAGEYGSGEELSEVGLASMLQVSRTPVREALRRLAAEGLVKTSRNRRSTVVLLSRVDVIEAYQVRQALEAGAARLAATQITQSQIEQLYTLADASEPAPDRHWDEAAGVFDLALHYTIALAAGNEKLREEISRYNRIVWLVRQRAANQGRRAISRREHLLILAALNARDPDCAASAMSQHIASSLQGVLEALPLK